MEPLAKGPKDANTGKKLGLSEDEGETNQKAGDAYLAENTRKDGVVTLTSGLHTIR